MSYQEDQLPDLDTDLVCLGLDSRLFRWSDLTILLQDYPRRALRPTEARTRMPSLSDDPNKRRHNLLFGDQAIMRIWHDPSIVRRCMQCKGCLRSPDREIPSLSG